MKFYSSLYPYINVLIFIFFQWFATAYAKSTTIKILIKKPDEIETRFFNEKFEVIKQKYRELAQNDPKTRDTELEFIYCPCTKQLESNIFTVFQNKFMKDKDYLNYLTCISDHIKNRKCDMLILDDKIIFGDDALIENYAINRLFGYKRVRSNFLELDKYIDQKEYSFHDREIFEDGSMNGTVYGFPFEIDFDLIYYHKESAHLNRLSRNTTVWDDFLDMEKLKIGLNQNQLNPKWKGPISLSLGDKGELLSIFIEYTGYEFGKTYVRNNTVSIGSFLGSEQHFINFKKFIMKTTGASDEDMKDLLNVHVDAAYDAFLNGEYPLYVGKASYYKYIRTNNNDGVLPLLMPMGVTVMTEKYVIVNKNSRLDMEMLAKAAKILSSMEMQNYKIEKLGSLPTFGIHEKNNVYKGTDNETKNSQLHCPINQDVCNTLKFLYTISIKHRFFNQQSSSSLMEVRDILPQALMKFLLDNDAETVVKTFKNNIVLNNYSNDYWDLPFILLYGSFLVLIVFALVIITLVYRYRNHPYLKMISPRICILVILGFVATTVSIPFYGHFSSVDICKVGFILGIIIRDMVFLPMFIIVYRIYYIYTNESKVNFGKKLNDRRLFCYIGFIMFINISIGVIIVIFKDFYIINVNCNQRHYFRSEFEGSDIYSCIYLLYYLIIIVGVLYMIIKTRKTSKKYDEIKILYITFVLSVVSIVMEWIYFSIPSKNFSIYFSIICFIYMFTCILCIYLLVGSRLIYVIKHPVNSDSPTEDNNHNDYFNVVDISDFIPGKKGNGKKKNTALYDTEDTLNPTNSIVAIPNDEFILNNPNNYFFNQSLEKLSKPEKALTMNTKEGVQ
ncbi:hypothetical protein PIROE2DRAFT_64881 [Piromyces sp. E2]|nr:hypothetical protein PIROE2DRAFT_64881 [Piromyces sp. E2]|eukprot:OUM57649.1 hypothetical protein PIROE2DRAFT_64881 [Piromyces sp. E2]